MDLEAEAKRVIEAAKRRGVSEFLEETEIPNLHAGIASLKAVAKALRGKTPEGVARALGVLQAAARRNAALLAELEKDGADSDAAQAIVALAESHAGQASQAVLSEAERNFKSRLHEERGRIRADLARKGWRKPSTQKEAATRSVLDFLRAHAYITAEQAGDQLGLHDGDVHRAQEVLSIMRREGYVERVRIKDFTGRTTSAYVPTEIGSQYNPRGELPQTGKIKDRMCLLRYLQEHGDATKAEIDALTTSANILFNSVRDGVVESRDGRYYVSGKGMGKLQRIRKHPADSRANVMNYLTTHGSIANVQAQEITGLSLDGARLLMGRMRTEGVIQYAGAVGNVLTDGHKPVIELEGGTHTEQVLRYADSLGGTVPVSQIRNLFPYMSGRQRSDLIHSLTHGYDGGASYCEKIDGNLVMTQRGYERLGLMPVTP